MKTAISCIGSGNMGTALMKGAAAVIGAENIGYSDIDLSKAKNAAAGLGGNFFQSNTEAVSQAELIFLAVKPQVFRTVLDEISPVLEKRIASAEFPLLVSMVTGWTIAKIQSCFPVKVPLARIMPNTPALISRGMITVALSPEVPVQSAVTLKKILGASGITVETEEKYFDAVTGLSGSGPAFVYMFIEALSDGGVRAGLPRSLAQQFAAQTVLGSAAMVLQTGRHPGELKDMVTSPGGTTIAGIAALENGAFRGTVINAVEAAWRRAAELGK